MAGETIRDLVERCYSTPAGILGTNPLDQLNPNVPQAGSAGNVLDEPDPGDQIRNIVGRCYTVPVYNQPNPLDQTNPIPEGDPPVVVPDPKPGDVIRRIVERCYGPPPKRPEIPKLPLPPDLTTGWDPPPWIPWISTLIGWDPPVKVTIKPPDLGDPVIIIKIGPEDQCEKVARLLQLDLVRPLTEYEELPDFPAPGWWEHKETGEKLYCDLDKGNLDDPFKKCVRNALDCLFRPYLGGMWQPPKADCSAYWPNGWSGNQTEVCVENCYPDRIPIYESYDASGTLAVSFDASGQLVATGTGAAVVILKLQWNDRPWTYGTAIDSIQVGADTWTRTGRSGEIVKSINLSSAGTTSVVFNGLHPANSTLTIVDNNTRICLKDGDGNDCNANFSIVSTNLSADHAYDSQGAKAGYTLTNTKPAFYILKNPIAGKTVPLFRFYSTLKNDTFLTTNPGEPDTAGVGERPTMNANGHAGGEVIGHVFPTALAMNSYLHDDEQAESLHRFHSSNPFDHRYSIDSEFVGGMPKKIPKRWCYRIPNEVKADLNVQMDVEKGTAGYDNAVGFYLADETGPKYGRVIVTSARNGTNLYEAYVPSGKLSQYAGGTMGFFLIPDGGGQNSLTINQEIAFESYNVIYDGGFRGTGISTAQSNYCLFSDREWNPKKKDQTKWQGKNNQFWEDLIDGDDDYDDLRFWHRIGWTYGGYVYEGIQCYVYAGAAPEKVMRKVDPSVKCDTRILKASFKDVIVRRNDCGNKIPNIVGNDVEWECGECVDDNTWYVNPASLAWRITDPDGGTSNVSATFDASGNLVTTGTGTAEITFSFSWSDNPGTYGTALGTYEIPNLAIQFTQDTSTSSGSLSDQTVTIVGGQTYNCLITDGNAAGFDRQNGNQTLCFKDGDSNDCNATLSIVSITQQPSEIEITNSVTEKGSWAQVGASNNPANGWSQHMIDYGIYPSVPADTVIDPLIGEWQVHTATVNLPSNNVYSIRIESDNYGEIKLTDPNGSVLVDREINYSNGIGNETLRLNLNAGAYTMQTRVKNLNRGNYTIRLNAEQTIDAAVGGTFRFVSMGGITGGIYGSCMKFTIRMKKNGVELFTKQFEAQYWPAIGRDLYDQDITLTAGDPMAEPVVPPDNLTLELVSIDTGAVTGDIALEASLYNTETKKFEGAFKIMLGTQSHDAVIGEQQGATTLNPIKKEGGEIEGFAFAYNPTNRQEFEWEAGSTKAETWSEDNVPDPGYPYTYVWANNIPVAMHGSLQANPEIPGQSRITNNPQMPTLPGAYIDTAYLYDDPVNYFSATLLESYNYRNLSGVYNHLVEDFLFTRFETLSGYSITQEQKDILTKAAPTTFARGSKPWYTLGTNTEENKWFVNPATLAWRITQGGVEIATSIGNKGGWVATGASNNPGNGWTQFMKSYGIYPVVPNDDTVDPFIGSWQTHVANVVFPSSTSYTMKIQSDNWGYIKITNPSGTVLMDREINYVNGAGDETIPLTLSAGTYTIETRVKNANVGSYQDVVASIWDGAALNPQRDTFFSPITFIHDYTLDNYHGTGGSGYADAAKIRVGITFYPVVFNQTTGSKQVHYWQAMIHVIDVIDKGKGYTKGTEFVLTWPPMRERYAEDPSQTPYYPDQVDGFFIPAGKQLAWWENEDLVRRSLKEAFYQESHNKNSMVWYSGTDKAKFRVRFKLTVTQSTDPP